MRRLRSSVWSFLVLLAILWGAWSYAGAWRTASEKVARSPNGRDFASYFLALRAVEAGRNPYLPADLRKTARENGRRGGVHPFFYPPPFLSLMLWTSGLDLPTAYQRWAIFDAACAVAALVALALWWRELHPVVPAVLAVLLGLTSAIPNNHVMGQANHLVLLLVILGLWADAREHQGVAGFLVGLACMAKMSPALFVLWWLLRRRWRAAGASILTAVGVSLLTLWVVPLDVQVYFYTDVLPQFASGKYNGLAVPIDLFGNHSIPNLLHQLAPSSTGGLSTEAQRVGRGVALLLLGGMGWRFRHPSRDPLTLASQASAVAILMLLLPVYTYEHHLVWSLPAIAVVAAGLARRRLSWFWLVPFGVAAYAITYDLQVLKRAAQVGGNQGLLLQELKFLALLFLFAATIWLGGSRPLPSEDQGTSQPDQVAV